MAGKISESPLVSLLRAASRLAVDFHDIGKGTDGFGEALEEAISLPLKDRTKRQPIRHELISVVLLNSMINIAGASDDAAFLDALSNPQTATRLIEEAFIRLPSDLARCMKAGKSGSPIQLPDRNRFPLMHTVGCLVLTHHRLPTAAINIQKRTILLRDQDHVQARDAELFAPFTRSSVSVPIWRETGFIRLVARDAEALAEMGGIEDGKLWLAAVAVYGRTALMLGDHLGSSQKRPYRLNPQEALARRSYGNTINLGPNKPAILADSLAVHTARVRSMTDRIFSTLTNNLPLPALERSDLPALITSPATGRYRWQNDVIGAMQACEGSGGFFGLLIAGTGAGKTLAAGKILTAEDRPIRLNVLLGLRSLTLQTGDEYRLKTGFRTGDIATIVGSELTEMLHRLAQDDDDDAEMEDLTELVVGGCATTNELVEHLAQGKEKIRRMLTSPILVSTIDTVMPAARARRGGHLAAMLRVATADCVIDELDMYCEEDVVAICRLLFLVGAFGRRAVVSSATLSPAIAEAAYEAYRSGYRVHAGLFEHEDRVRVGWFSDSVVPCIVEDGKSFDFAKAHKEFAGAMVATLPSQPVRRKVGILTITGSATSGEVFDRVLDGVVGLHSDNHVVDPATGKRLSIGVVRWSKTRDCRSFAYHALDHELPGVEHRVLCYHSRHPLVVRFHIERLLDAMLTRKSVEGVDPIFQHPTIRSLLDKASTSDVIIIISTTPILEIGRDHDFDWCVAEPCSNHSSIQIAGRVGRHRIRVVDQPNILMMDTAFSVVAARWRDHQYPQRIANPGLETSVYLPSRNLGFSLLSRNTKDMFDMDLWKERLDAQVALQPGISNAAAVILEERRKRVAVLGDGDAATFLLSARGFLEDPARLLDAYHAVHRPFRRKEDPDVIYWREGQTWLRLLPDDERPIPANRSVLPDAPLSENQISRLLMPVDIDDILDQVQALAAEKGIALKNGNMTQLMSIAVPRYGDDPVMFYEPNLGGHWQAIET